MRLAPVSLWLAAMAFAGAGAAFLAAPVLVRLVHLAPQTATALSDVRAVFGGLELGVAALLGHCARRPTLHRIGLLAQAVTFGGLVLGRILSLLLDGVPEGITLALGSAELLGAAIAVIALRQLGPASDATTS